MSVTGKRLPNFTVCPRSLVHFCTLSIYKKNGQDLLDTQYIELYNTPSLFLLLTESVAYQMLHIPSYYKIIT